MDPKEPSKNVIAEKINAAARLKRRDTYRQISVDRREGLLLMRRMKRQQPAKDSLPENENIIIPEQSTSSGSKLTLPRHPALTIRELPPAVEKAMYPQPCVGTTHNNLEKGKEICSPSVIYKSELMSAEENNNHSSPAKSHAEMKLGHHEIYSLISATEGSQDCFPINFPATSAVPVNESHLVVLPIATGSQQNIAPSLYTYEVGSTSGTSNAKCNLPSLILRNKGHKQCRTSCVNINQVESAYVHLKIVPNCKFCNAKRFEYEPPGFCCNSGSIKLVSNQIKYATDGQEKRWLQQQRFQTSH